MSRPVLPREACIEGTTLRPCGATRSTDRHGLRRQTDIEGRWLKSLLSPSTLFGALRARCCVKRPCCESSIDGDGSTTLRRFADFTRGPISLSTLGGATDARAPRSQGRVARGATRGAPRRQPTLPHLSNFRGGRAGATPTAKRPRRDPTSRTHLHSPRSRRLRARGAAPRGREGVPNRRPERSEPAASVQRARLAR